ncbi:MAG: ester cyclase [Cyanobacteria bacterium P01_F01_bin.33]
MSISQNRAIVLRFAQEGWGTQPDWENVWDELMTPDIIHHFNSEAEPIVGLEANKTFNASLFQGFPDIQQTIGSVIAEGDEVVYRAMLNGTHTGEFLGILPTGKIANINGFTLLRIVNGKIVEWWYECNLLELTKQLGLSAD